MDHDAESQNQLTEAATLPASSLSDVSYAPVGPRLGAYLIDIFIGVGTAIPSIILTRLSANALVQSGWVTLLAPEDGGRRTAKPFLSGISASLKDTKEATPNVDHPEHSPDHDHRAYQLAHATGQPVVSQFEAL